MVQDYRYRSPTTPGNPGWDDDLGNKAVRLGSIQGIVQEAELGAVGISSIMIDDPTGTAGHASDAIVGLKQFDWIESAPGAGNRRIWTGYIGDRKYRRGSNAESPSLRTGAARVIDITLVDINSFLSFRVFTPEVGFNRPAETDVARVTALLATSLLSTTLFDGLVSTASPVNMDAVDYAGQRPSDVLNDCAQQSGKNFFVFYDEAGTYTPAAGEFALFYDFNDSPVYLSTLQVSNVLADFDNSTTFYPFIEDGELSRDPSRVVSGVLIQNGSNSVYEKLLTTSYKYGYRDAVASAQNLKTPAQAKARADRYLAENATEDDRISFTIKVPAAHVNDWKAGQGAQVKFTHLPGYEAYRYVRALTRTTRQSVEDDTHYDVHYECTPMALAPHGAFSVTRSGVADSGVPILLNPTTPGNVLLLVVVGQGNTTQFPIDIRMLDDPVLSPPPIPPYADHAGWTVLGTATTDFGGMNIGGPCTGFGGIPCTAGVIVGIAWRYVQTGEKTTHPVAVSLDTGPAASSSCAAWLWELPPSAVPTAVGTLATTHNGTNPGTFTLPSGVGSVLGVFGFPQVDPIAQPISATPGANITTVQSTAGNNDPTLNTASGWINPWCYIAQMPIGGALNVNFHANGSYTSLNGCGVAVLLPGSVTLPNIPFPANAI